FLSAFSDYLLSLHSFPTRRSSDLAFAGIGGTIYDTKINALDENDNPYNFASIPQGAYEDRKDTRNSIKDMLDDSYETDAENHGEDRKSTRLNSSHVKISYAVFCLK